MASGVHGVNTVSVVSRVVEEHKKSHASVTILHLHIQDINVTREKENEFLMKHLHAHAIRKHVQVMELI